MVVFRRSEQPALKVSRLVAPLVLDGEGLKSPEPFSPLKHRTATELSIAQSKWRGSIEALLSTHHDLGTVPAFSAQMLAGFLAFSGWWI
jgi:hypothetical protein